jgi:uncharacterized protein Usg
MASEDFIRQMQGYGLSTVEIHYFSARSPEPAATIRPPAIRRRPALSGAADYLDFWRREIEAVLHSVRIAHAHLIGPSEWRAIDGVISIN